MGGRRKSGVENSLLRPAEESQIIYGFGDGFDSALSFFNLFDCWQSKGVEKEISFQTIGQDRVQRKGEKRNAK